MKRAASVRIRFGGGDMGFLSPSIPSPPTPPVPPPAAMPATLANPQVAGAGAAQRQAAAAAGMAGFGGTLTNEGGAAGTTPQNTATRSLLG
jgi:hypothetical protein